MKKFLLMAAAGLMAFTASAADYYLVGDNFGWADNETYGFAANGDGTYTLDLKGKEKNELKLAFKIKQKGTWDNAFGTNGKTFKADETYNAERGNSTGNISCAGTIVDAKITLNPTKKTIFATGATKENEYTTVYMVGDFGSGWNDAITTYPLTLKEGSESVWVADYELKATDNYFKFRAGDFIYGPSGSDKTPALGESCQATSTGDKAFLLHPGKYHFEWTLVKNATSGTLVVTSYPETLYVIGIVNGKEWAPDNGVALEKTGEGQFKGTVLIGNALINNAPSGFGYFSFTESTAATWDKLGTRFGAKTNDFVPTMGEACELTNGENAFKVTADKEYEITVDLTKMTVIVDQIAEIVMPTPPDQLTIEPTTETEGLTTEWDPDFAEINVTGEVAETSVTITLNIPEGFDNYLYINPEGDDSNIELLTRAEASEWVPVEELISNGMKLGNQFEIPADGEEHIYNLYLVANNKADTANLYTLSATIKQKTTGVEAIEVAGEAQYFTLQGVKVANPSNGIYVKVVNGKASKVTLK